MVKILVMDNELDTLSSVKTILEKEKYEIVCANTGQRAINEVKTKKFDLIILDIRMPDILGWDVFQRVMEINPKQKVIFLSVLDVPQEWKKKLEIYGSAEYIVKPFDRTYFIQRVKAALPIIR